MNCWLIEYKVILLLVTVPLFFAEAQHQLSSDNMQVLGNGKGMIASILSVFLFGNYVPVLGWVGYGITIAGVVAYSESKKAPSISSTPVQFESGELLSLPANRCTGVNETVGPSYKT